jgi:hypothetical protein
MASASPARPGALAGAADAKNQMAEILAPPRRRNDCCRLLHAAWPPRPRLNSKTSTSQSACVHHGGRGKAAGQRDQKIPFASVCRTWSRQATGRRIRSSRPPKVPRRLWIWHAGLACRRFADECGHADPPAQLHSHQAIRPLHPALSQRDSRSARRTHRRIVDALSVAKSPWPSPMNRRRHPAAEVHRRRSPVPQTTFDLERYEPRRSSPTNCRRPRYSNRKR